MFCLHVYRSLIEFIRALCILAVIILITNPLRFSLPDTNSKFSLGDDPGTATATVTLAKGDGTANLEIGLQVTE